MSRMDVPYIVAYAISIASVVIGSISVNDRDQDGWKGMLGSYGVILIGNSFVKSR